MDNKIEQLTKKLYDEGVSKGIQESEEIIAKAKADAQKIVADAEKQASEIIEASKKEAEDLSKNSRAELAMATTQIVGELKLQIADIIDVKTLKADVTAAFSSEDFVKSLILEVIKHWDKESVKLYIETNKKEDIKKYYESVISKQFKGEVEIVGDNALSTGFRIAPKDGSYFIDFNAEQFDNMLKGYLRATLNELLFKK